MDTKGIVNGVQTPKLALCSTKPDAIEQKNFIESNNNKNSKLLTVEINNNNESGENLNQVPKPRGQMHSSHSVAQANGHDGDVASKSSNNMLSLPYRSATLSRQTTVRSAARTASQDKQQNGRQEDLSSVLLGHNKLRRSTSLSYTSTLRRRRQQNPSLAELPDILSPKPKVLLRNFSISAYDKIRGKRFNLNGN